MGENKFVERIVERGERLEDDRVKKIKTFDVFTNGNGHYYHDNEIEIIVYDNGSLSISMGHEFTYVNQDQLELLKESIVFAEKVNNDK